MGFGHSFLQQGQCGQGFHPCPGQVGVTGTQGEGQGVKEEVGGMQPAGNGQIVQAQQHSGLFFTAAGHPMFVYGQADHGSAEIRCQAEYFFGPCATVFKVDGVDYGPARALPEPRLERFQVGAVEHQRQAILRVQPRRRPGHIAGFAASGIGHVQVEQVRPFPRLGLGHGQHGVQIVRQQRRPELPAARGVGLFADDQWGGLDPEFLDREQGGRQPRGSGFFLRRRPQAARHAGQDFDMAGSGPAAAANQACPVFLNKNAHLPGERFGFQVIDIAAFAEYRQPGVGHHRQGKRRRGGQDPDRVPHVFRTGAAIDAESKKRVRDKSGQCRGRVGAQQHAAFFQGDQHAHRAGLTFAAKNTVQGAQCRLDLQHILAGLHLEQVDAAVKKPKRLCIIGIFQAGEVHLLQTGQARTGPHGTRHIARLRLATMVGGDPGRQFGGFPVYFIGPVLQSVLGQLAGLGAEGVGLDDIAAAGQVGFVDTGDDFGPGDGKIVVAAYVAVVIVGAQCRVHDGRAHGAVQDQDFFLLATGDFRFEPSGHGAISGSQRFPANTVSRKALAARPWPMLKTWMPGTP